MTRDEFLTWEELPPEDSLNLLRSFFDPWWPIARLTQKQVDILRAIIHPEVSLFSFMNTTTDSAQEASIKVLDLRQENHARSIGNGHRIIYGVPGSGKTIILVARAKLIASTNSGNRHLFLCYNVALAGYIQQLLREYPNVVVRHFDGWSKDQGATRQNHEDDNSLGGSLLKLLKAGKGEAGRYSSVFIDEAQDFAESWFSCALEAMQEPLDGDLIVVGDGNQGLYRHRHFTWASVGIQAVGRTINAKFDLDRCYRSTKEVMKLAQAFATVGTEQAEIAIASMQVDAEQCARSSGFRPVLMACKSPEEECLYAAAIAKELMEGKWFGRTIPQPVLPSEIGILYRKAGGDQNKRLLAQLEVQLGQAVWINRDRSTLSRIEEPLVKIQTIHSAKGLQYKAVILLWAGQMPSDHSNDDLQIERRLMFVGLTRAEDYVTVLHSRPSAFVDELKATGAADTAAN